MFSFVLFLLFLTILLELYVFRVCRKCCGLFVSSHLYGREVCKFTWSSDLWKVRIAYFYCHESPGFFLSPTDFSAIEAVSCSACVEDSPSKILQRVFFSFVLHVQTSDPSIEKKIFVFFLCLFPTAKTSFSIYSGIK